MKKINSSKFYPDWNVLLILGVLIFHYDQLMANEKLIYELYEKNFKTVEMRTREHKTLKLNQIKPKLILVNFWASWCIPCLEEIPSLIKFSGKYKADELSVVMINTEIEDQLQNIVKMEKKFSFPSTYIVIADDKFKIADQYKFKGIPVTIIYKEGKVVLFSNGPVDFSKLKIE